MFRDIELMKTSHAKSLYDFSECGSYRILEQTAVIAAAAAWVWKTHV
jgi:hypothetical protein